MNWEKLLNAERFGETPEKAQSDKRTQFQRDYDRLIFSSEFRKLQSKTQVFPLPESIFVHNRLTHSLEVSCVGRSIAKIVTDFLIQQNIFDSELLSEIPVIVSTACLIHDIGNPPFGHSGEKALSSYFLSGEGEKFKYLFNSQEWNDLCNFNGNANLLRLLTHQFSGRRKGGFAITYATLGSMLKYPCSSDEKRKKYGHFFSENDTFSTIVEKCGMKLNDQIVRHPLVYIVEAADDISYLIMDIEDANRLKIITEETCIDYFLPFLEIEPDTERKFVEQSKTLSKTETIQYLRSLIINILVKASAQVFIDNYEKITTGRFNFTISSNLPKSLKLALENCQKLGTDTIYCDAGVIGLEIAGHKILNTLIDNYCNAIFTLQNDYSKLLLKTIPEMYKPTGTPYQQVRLINDYISSMTDFEALRNYREIMSIDLPGRVLLR